MQTNLAYLAHCISRAPACDVRGVGYGLCLIDGAILGALPVDTEHNYRLAHHRDAALMAGIAPVRRATDCL